MAAAVVLAVLAGELAGWRFLRQPMQHLVTRAAGVPVVLEGEFRLRLFRQPGLAVQHLVVAAAPGLQVAHLLDAQEVQVAWRWRDLWRWQRGDVLRLRRLQAKRLDAQLVRGPDGRASWQIGPASGPSGSTTAAAPGAVPRGGILVVDQGHILFDDPQLATHLEIDVHGSEGTGGPQGYEAMLTGRYRALPLRLRARSGAVLPLLGDDEPGDAAPALEVQVDGQAGVSDLHFDGRASALWSARRLDGAVRLRGPSLASLGEPLGVTLPHTPPFELAGWLSQSPGLWHLRADRMAVGRSLLAGEFRYAVQRQPAQLSGRLQGPRLALADLGPAVGVPPAAQPAGEGRVLPQRRFDLPSLRAMDADVQVRIDELDFASTAVKSLRGLSTRVLLEAGVLQLQDFKAQVAGGQVDGSMRLEAPASTARWAADLRLTHIAIEDWIRGLRPTSSPGQGQASVRAYLTGELNAHVKVTGTGRSTAEILSTLDGEAKLRLGEGTLSHLATEVIGLDVAQALGVAIRGDRPLPLRCARVELAVHNGVVEPELAVLDNRDSTLRLSGRVDLRTESLALRLVTRPKDLSPLSLRTPVTVTGTMRKPELGIEARGLAGRVLGAVALGTAVGPAAALLPLVDPGSKDAAGDPCVNGPMQR
ncbi:MAG TPA: AsmA family protein [Burkholderiaceae bacterium]|nr:AsmA family protein [Burkholderiaceae bacterium]